MAAVPRMLWSTPFARRPAARRFTSGGGSAVKITVGLGEAASIVCATPEKLVLVVATEALPTTRTFLLWAALRK
jgi:hypothetical protein